MLLCEDRQNKSLKGMRVYGMFQGVQNRSRKGRFLHHEFAMENMENGYNLKVK